MLEKCERCGKEEPIAGIVSEVFYAKDGELDDRKLRVCEVCLSHVSPHERIADFRFEE